MRRKPKPKFNILATADSSSLTLRLNAPRARGPYVWERIAEKTVLFEPVETFVSRVSEAGAELREIQAKRETALLVAEKLA
jgi:hypothetical protein